MTGQSKGWTGFIPEKEGQKKVYQDAKEMQDLREKWKEDG